MRTLFFLLISFISVSCTTADKSANYDSSIQTNLYNSKKDMIDTLRSVANLDRDDFDFITEKMKNIVENYMVLQAKFNKLENKINRMVTNKSIGKSVAQNKEVQIVIEELSDDTVHFTDNMSTSSKEEAVTDSNPESKSLLQSNEINSQVKDRESLFFIDAKKLYSKKSWQSAISKFQEYRDKNPKGLYVIEATYYMGEAFKKLNMLPESRVFYKEIMKFYPQSSWALKAQKQLSK